jgi:hypothetical protein
LLYRTVKTEDDAKHLQEDLNELQQWEQDWRMHFNPDKCEVIRITTKRKQRITPYYIHWKELAITTKAKYLEPGSAYPTICLGTTTLTESVKRQTTPQLFYAETCQTALPLSRTSATRH